MNELEDEPVDVQRASPVEEEIKRGEYDQVSSKTIVALSAKLEQLRHQCEKEKPAIPEEVGRCELKRRRLASRQKIVTMYVHEEPCELTKQEIIPRRCMSNKEYIDFLAKPKEHCPSLCARKLVKRRVRPLSPRIDELAKPMTRRLKHTLEERANVLSPQMIENMFEILENETALTAEQAEQFVRDRRAARPKRPPKKQRKSKCKPPSPCEVSHRPSMLEGGDSIDPEIAEQQYSIAKRFVRSILNYKCPIPCEDYRDISETVLEMLSEVLEYSPVGNEDRKSRQMRVLADCFACWLAGILLRLSEKNKLELEEECLRLRREAEEKAAWMAMQSEDADDEDEDDDDRDTNEEDDEDEEDREKMEAARMAMALAAESAAADGFSEKMHTTVSIMEDSSTQYELQAAPPAEAAEPSTFGTTDGEEEMDGEEDSLMLLKLDADAAQQTEPPEANPDAATETVAELRTVASQTAAAKSREQLELEKIASRVSRAFDTDAPFVTFVKLMDTLYAMLEAHSENRLCDPLDNRVHRAIYEKLTEAIEREDPCQMTDRVRDVVDVVSGKVARWLRRTLDDCQIRFLTEETPAKIESREVREWSTWLEEMLDQGENWSSWIETVVTEAQCMKRDGKVTRGAWQDWTSGLQNNAIKMRETYLKALHQQHWNTMMMTQRQVLKTGTKVRHLYPEETIKNTNFESPSRT